MLILLPPSETKRPGGVDDSRLDLDALGFSSLYDQRSATVSAVRRLAADPDATVRALKLGRTQLAEVDRNRAVAESPVMPALDRYTGVLFDALDAPSLTATERRFAHRHVAIHSALFGPIRALDPIPAYRLSHDSRLPGMPLKRHWRTAVAAELEASDAFIVDLRSEGYAELGPAPAGALYVRVSSEDATGRRSALNHFNKKAKGLFTRAVIRAGIDHPDAESLLRWAAASGIRLELGATGELDLVA